GAVVRDTQMNVGVVQHLADLAAILAGQRNHLHVPVVGGFNGLDDVFRVAAGGNGHQQVAGLAQRIDLLGKNAVIAEVIADGGQDRGVGVERQGGQRQAVALKAADQLGDEVLGVGGR